MTYGLYPHVHTQRKAIMQSGHDGVVLAPRKKKDNDFKFEGSLGYTDRPSFKRRCLYIYCLSVCLSTYEINWFLDQNEYAINSSYLYMYPTVGSNITKNVLILNSN